VRLSSPEGLVARYRSHTGTGSANRSALVRGRPRLKSVNGWSGAVPHMRINQRNPHSHSGLENCRGTISTNLRYHGEILAVVLRSLWAPAARPDDQGGTAHAGHIRNMLAVTEMGSIVHLSVPPFCTEPRSVQDIIEHCVGRALHCTASD
jgi:hypothetical protein